MSSTARLAFALTLAAATAAPAAAAEASIPLARVAAETGYAYAFLASEHAVSLSRPGVVVILRAGQRLYRIGDRIVSADSAPVFDGTDLVVTPAVAAVLRRVAQEHPLPPSPAFMPEPVTSATGALTVEARPVPGRDAIAIRGRGPAGVPVTVTLTGEISRDLPVVVLARVTTRTGSDGAFATEIGTSAGPPRGSRIVATATSVTGVTPGTASLVVGQTNPALDSPLDTIPK